MCQISTNSKARVYLCEVIDKGVSMKKTLAVAILILGFSFSTTNSASAVVAINPFNSIVDTGNYGGGGDTSAFTDKLTKCLLTAQVCSITGGYTLP